MLGMQGANYGLKDYFTELGFHFENEKPHEGAKLWVIEKTEGDALKEEIIAYLHSQVLLSIKPSNAPLRRSLVVLQAAFYKGSPTFPLGGVEPLPSQ